MSYANLFSSIHSRESFISALHLEDGEQVLAGVGEGIRSIFEQDEKKTMVQANAAFVDGRLSVLESYKKTLQTLFDGEFQEVS